MRRIVQFEESKIAVGIVREVYVSSLMAGGIPRETVGYVKVVLYGEAYD